MQAGLLIRNRQNWCTKQSYAKAHEATIAAFHPAGVIRLEQPLDCALVLSGAVQPHPALTLAQSLDQWACYSPLELIQKNTKIDGIKSRQEVEQIKYGCPSLILPTVEVIQNHDQCHIRIIVEQSPFTLQLRKRSNLKCLLKGLCIIQRIYGNRECIPYSRLVHNLTIDLDLQLLLKEQMPVVAKRLFTQIYYIPVVFFQGLGYPFSQSHSLLISQMDYCNAVYMGLTWKNIWKLQLAHNTVVYWPCLVRTVYKLHWLPVVFHMKFEVLKFEVL